MNSKFLLILSLLYLNPMIQWAQNNTETYSKPKFLLKNIKEYYSQHKKDISINNFEAFVSSGTIIHKNTYCLTQVGVAATIFTDKNVLFVPEGGIGLASDFHKKNLSLSLIPVLFRYRYKPELQFEMGIDVYTRFYNNGNSTRLGWILGAGYQLKDNKSLGLRGSINKSPFIGFVFRWQTTWLDNWIFSSRKL